MRLIRLKNITTMNMVVRGPIYPSSKHQQLAVLAMRLMWSDRQ